MAAKTRRQEVVFSDVRGDFLENPATNDLLLYTNEDAIIQSIRNLLLTNRYERPFQKNVGSDITGLLFELDTPMTQYALKNAIIECIENYEPRCNLLNLIIIPAPELNTYIVEITFSLITSQDPVSFNLLLQRNR